MATETIDLSSLAALEAPAAASVPAAEPAVGIPASDLPAKTGAEAEPVKTEEPKVDAEVKAEGKPGETKVENAVRVELSKKAPQVLAKNVHDSLKAFMAEHPSPEGVAKLREINDAVAVLYQQVADAKGTASDIKEVVESAESLQAAVNSSDEMLYRADPELINNILEDVKATNGNLYSFAKLGVSWIEKMQTECPAEFTRDIQIPIFQSALQESGVVDSIRDLIKNHNSGDAAGLRKTISALRDYVQELGSVTEKRTQEIESDKATVANEKYHTEQKDACDVRLNQSLAVPFKTMVSTTEASTFTRPQLLAIASEARKTAQTMISQDQLYVRLLNQAYAAKNTAEIERLHSVKVNAVAAEAVKKAVATLYPRGLSPKVAKAAASPKGTYSEFKEGRFLNVKDKPQDLDMSVKGADIMFIAGRGVRKDGTKVVWRKN